MISYKIDNYTFLANGSDSYFDGKDVENI
jgi:hypothetical protein